MNKIYIWGAGYYSKVVFESVNKNLCIIKGFIDIDSKKQGRYWGEGIEIFSPDILLQQEFDYILISVQKYQTVYDCCLNMGIEKDKIIAFWKSNEKETLIDYKGKRIIELEKEVKKYKNRWENVPYEYGLEKTPVIKPGTELLEYILEKKVSLSRFGDGEFELMFGRNRPWFQKTDKYLSKRLKEILQSKEENIVITIADNFGCLEKYNEENADAIREYMSLKTRKEIMEYIDLEHEYYDAYVTRPYIIYKDKENASQIFRLFKKIWENRNVILIEGEYSRIGVGNDLFVDAADIKRVLCPSQDAWIKYKEIIECVRNVANINDLICISLGPTATVLAYDLAKMGFQCLDIGQLDNEYEWYLKRTVQRTEIPGKMVAEMSQNIAIGNCSDMSYQLQIISKI